MQPQPFKSSVSEEAPLIATQQVGQPSVKLLLNQSNTSPATEKGIVPPLTQQAATSTGSQTQPKTEASQKGLAKGIGESALQSPGPLSLSTMVPSVPLTNFPNATIPSSVNHMFTASSQEAKPHADAESNGNVTPIPAIFRGCRLRSGKWLPEEEKYAQVLIGLFAEGHIMDCENGATLRAYLSVKLHCAPMRISKKYAGQGIGKLIYSSKILRVGLPPAEQENITNAVKEAERKFHWAIFSGRALFQVRTQY